MRDSPVWREKSIFLVNFLMPDADKNMTYQKPEAKNAPKRPIFFYPHKIFWIRHFGGCPDPLEGCTKR